MPSLYPSINKVKNIELFGELISLDSYLKESLDFYGKNKLLTKTAFLLENEENIECGDLTLHKNELNKFIYLIYSIHKRVKQFSLLNSLVQRYCDSSESQDQIDKQKTELEKEITKYPLDSQEIQNRLTQINFIFCENFKKIFKKIKELLERDHNNEYKDYFENHLNFFTQLEDIIENSFPNGLTSLDTICNTFVSIIEFERKHPLFLIFSETFKRKYDELIPTLLNVEIINLYKNELKDQSKNLYSKLSTFDPNPKTFEILDHDLAEFHKKLNALQKLNDKYKELNKQQEALISLIDSSGKKLNGHAENLPQSGMFSAKAKYQEIKKIKDKIDVLFNSVRNQEIEVSGQVLINSISELQQTINEAKEVLSKYRGILFLRCFATLWGGGKVKSEWLVNELEMHLVALQSNTHVLNSPGP